MVWHWNENWWFLYGRFCNGQGNVADSENDRLFNSVIYVFVMISHLWIVNQVQNKPQNGHCCGLDAPSKKLVDDVAYVLVREKPNFLFVARLYSLLLDFEHDIDKVPMFFFSACFLRNKNN